MTLRIAIACSGLGRVRRGFESFTEDLFRHLRDSGDVDITLFKGTGPQVPGEVPIWNISRHSYLWRPAKRVIDGYIGEQLTFALGLARHLRRGRFDLVQLSDCQLASSLLRLFPDGWRDFKILFTNGGALAPPHYQRFDLIQQVNPVQVERALEHGLDRNRMMLLPHAVNVDDYGKQSQETARRRLGLPDHLPLVLSVGAHEASKRHSYLLTEVASTGEDSHLMIAGEERTSRAENLRDLATQLLPGRVTFRTLPHALMPTVYCAADVFVISSLSEGFGLTLLEAMASGLPVVHHNEPGMNWIVGNAGVSVNMRRSGELAEVLNTLLVKSATREMLGSKARIRAERRFSWRVLLPKYFEMLETALSLPPNQ